MKNNISIISRIFSSIAEVVEGTASKDDHQMLGEVATSQNNTKETTVAMRNQPDSTKRHVQTVMMFWKHASCSVSRVGAITAHTQAL